uniref:Succinate:cytochrome c oxidoreductase subunit 3 n=1 Tax=Pyropia katadae TaxID=76161 RepID=H3JS56_PYRKA|nr:succinate:cytochrome c oxidoreductase subunit 3 [Neopyropia katadae]BBH62869.1 succinate:cytochrome c oxidoreductase subunit 3 [Neopyropia katadae]BBH62870.1 succinate:cytochrome c oxidoreductase subunit 3 [Neopyropia katadae]BBH62871.1 succinate:cytochrome c oxidoreductase subunit 3 [Neopyropia katadae]BBH62872.1 succinate:cytochrome c oxidoreductase subunit 3 [Neopyropia katadae]
MHNINRPISPHLTIYNSQISSTFSIWHRISGVVMFILISSPILILNQVYFSYTPIFLVEILLNYILSNWILVSFRLLISTIFLYHISNGFRHFLWDSVRHINTKKIYKDSNLLLFFVFIVTITQSYIEF